MAGRGRVAAVSIDLSEAERGALEGLSRRRRTAQGLARRAQIVLWAAAGLQNKQIAAHLGSESDDRRQMASAVCRASARRAVRRASPGRATADRRRGDCRDDPPDAGGEPRPTRRTGRCAAWPLRPATRRRRSIESGRPSACSRIAPRASSCRPIHCSWTRFATSSASTWRRPTVPSCCASTRRAKSRHSIEPNRCCRCAPVRPSAAATTTRGMARSRCLPRSTWRPAR